MNFHIITLFPGAFDSYLGESILKRAIEDKKIKVVFYNPRDFADNKFRHIDRPPYAGGPGMVVQAEPVARAIDAALKKIEKRTKLKKSKKEKQSRQGTLNERQHRQGNIKIIWFSPSGKQFTTDYAKKTAKKFTDIILVCGRYEGIDARVKKIFKTEEISIGPFVLTGGELPAEIFIDCVSRQVDGVLGNFDSLEESRVASSDVYTRPEVLEYNDKKYRVPKVLLSGDHKKIEEWKKKN